jgi:hypothetical protein
MAYLKTCPRIKAPIVGEDKPPAKLESRKDKRSEAWNELDIIMSLCQGKYKQKTGRVALVDVMKI